MRRGDASFDGEVDKGESADEVGYGQRDIVLHAAQQQQRLGLAVLGGKTYACVYRIGGAPETNRLPVDFHRTGQHAVVAEDRFGQFGTPGAHQPGEADNFAGMNIECDVPHSLGRQSLHGQGDAAPAPRSPIKEIRDGSPNHSVDDVGFRKFFRRPHRDQSSVAQHRDAVRQVSNLTHAMRNVDDGDAIVAEPANDPEKPLGFLFRKRRGRLVEGKHAQASAKRAHDFHELSLSRTEIARPNPWSKILLEPEFREHRDRSTGKVGSIEENPAHAPEVAEKEILGDGQIRNDVGFLVNHANAERVGVGRRPNRPPDAPREQLPLVGRKDAFKDTDERRFARAVFPDERKNLAGVNRQRDVVERPDHSKPLRHPNGRKRGSRLPHLRLISRVASDQIGHGRDAATMPRSTCDTAYPCRRRSCRERRNRPRHRSSSAMAYYP